MPAAPVLSYDTRLYSRLNVHEPYTRATRLAQSQISVVAAVSAEQVRDHLDRPAISQPIVVVWPIWAWTLSQILRTATTWASLSHLPSHLSPLQKQTVERVASKMVECSTLHRAVTDTIEEGS